MNFENELYIVNKKVLPEIFSKVIETKNLIKTGKVKTILEAVNKVGISRSAFYKYKDYVFLLNEDSRGKIVTISFNLDDTPGNLSEVLNIIANNNGNILTINQNIPVHKLANVTVSLDTKNIIDFYTFLQNLKMVKGIKNIKIIARE